MTDLNQLYNNRAPISLDSQLQQQKLLSKYGLQHQQYRQEEWEQQQSKTKKLFNLFKFKKEKEKEFGWDREKKFMDELANAEKLLKQCQSNLLFEPFHWKASNIRWKRQLKDLLQAAEEYASVKIYKQSLEIMERKKYEKPKSSAKEFGQ